MDWIRSLSEDSFLERMGKIDGARRRALIRLRMKEDPEFFARRLFPDYCRLPFSPMHRAIFRWHGRMGEGRVPSRRGLRFALAAPRGSAKSTLVSLILPLHDLLFRREKYMVLLSATERQAAQRLRAVRRELTRFPSRHCRLTARVLEYGKARMEAHGAGTELRGISHGSWRPTKIILDDAETSRCATSGRARLRLRDWFAEIVEYLGDSYTHLLAIGTILHEQSLLAELLRREDFSGLRTRSVISHADATGLWTQWKQLLCNQEDDRRRQSARDFFLTNRTAMEHGSEVLWPEKEDYEELMAQLSLQGRRAFMQEKQNMPLGPEDALFDASAALVAIEEEGSLVVRSGANTVRRHGPGWREGTRFGYLDAALGKASSRRGDFAAVATILVLPGGTLYLESLLARKCPPSEQVRLLLDLHEARPWDLLAIEGTGFQELLLLPLEEEKRRRRKAGRRADLPVSLVHPKRNKGTRIAALEPLLQSGYLVLSAGLDEEFWDELQAYPRSDHDDALDATAGAVQLAREHSALGSATRPESTGSPRQRPATGY